MLQLPNVTLFAVACTKVPQTIHALKQSMKGIAYHEVLLLTHENIDLSADGIKVVKIEKLDYKGYNHFILYRLKDYITSDYSLLVQNDGYVLRPDKWDDAFFDYDYIGAPWTKDAHFTKEGVNVRVGNGGFSFRSKKLLGALDELKLPFTDGGTGYFHEDGIICNYYHKELTDYGITFAPVPVAAKFSRETWCDDSDPYPFGFHRHKGVSPYFFLRPLVLPVLQRLGKDL